jgi:hypothetical protein
LLVAISALSIALAEDKVGLVQFRILVAVLAVTALAGCSSSPRRSVVSAAATSFVRAVESGDGAAACALLTPAARQSVSGATDTLCADAITSIDERGATVTGAQVWGDAAQVRVGADVVFLRRISGAWLVSAAGCDPRPKGPYDCKVGS